MGVAVAAVVAQSTSFAKKGGNPNAAKVKNPVAAAPGSLAAGSVPISGSARSVTVPKATVTARR